MFGFALVGLCATGCFDEGDDGETPPAMTSVGGSGGQNDDATATAGTAGSASTGGSPGTSTGGSAGTAGTGAGGTAAPSDAEEDEEAPPASGETGLFVGATAAHNAIRDALSTDEDLNPPLPPLTWSASLAVVAQDWADTLTSEQCGSIAHRPNGRYGENIAARGSRGISLDPMPPGDAVQGWADEAACWSYGRITGGNPNVTNGEDCEASCIAALSSNGCGHYTQLVWANTRQVGCGYSTCTDSDNFRIEVWVCNYDPPGNVIGQTPYTESN